jgi:hypothetical protein
VAGDGSVSLAAAAVEGGKASIDNDSTLVKKYRTQGASVAIVVPSASDAPSCELLLAITS